VNRSASGISRAKEILDPTGAYSNVNVFAEDGILYREESTQQFTFTFNNRSEIQSTIDTSVEAKLKEAYARQFYYLKYGTKDLSTECNVEFHHDINKHQHRILHIRWGTGCWRLRNVQFEICQK
jgi:spore coat protein CotH